MGPKTTFNLIDALTLFFYWHKWFLIYLIKCMFMLFYLFMIKIFLFKRNVEKVCLFFFKKKLFNPQWSASQIASLAYLVKLVGAYAMILFWIPHNLMGLKMIFTSIDNNLIQTQKISTWPNLTWISGYYLDSYLILIYTG
jgi:hypothetical protein